MSQESFSNDVWSLGDLSLDILSQDVLSQDVLSGHQKTGKERYDDRVDVKFLLLDQTARCSPLFKQAGKNLNNTVP